eukprot:6146165-Pleurochrysis_carterae.AAC.1
MHVLLHLFSDVRTVVQQRRRLDPRVGERLHTAHTPSRARGSGPMAQPERRLSVDDGEAAAARDAQVRSTETRCAMEQQQSSQEKDAVAKGAAH